MSVVLRPFRSRHEAIAVDPRSGAVFSPDGSTHFVNIQTPGVTVVITGPWEMLQKLVI